MQPLIMTVNFLFTPDYREVLMIHKDHGPYPDSLNGVGGKYEDEKDSISNDPVLNAKLSAKREIFEETEANILVNDLQWLVTERFPPGECPPWGDDREIELWVFCAIIRKSQVRQVERERLEWVKTSSLLSMLPTDETLAGSGNIPYFIRIALMKLSLVNGTEHRCYFCGSEHASYDSTFERWACSDCSDVDHGGGWI